MKNRNSNFELLRIISMILIILYHVILHGKVVENCTSTSLKLIFYFILFISIIHVNSFVLVTGYFQSKSTFKEKKVISLFLTSSFYMLVVITILQLMGIINLSKKEIIYELLLLNSDSYWFIKTYLLLYVISPYLNKLINILNKKEYQKLLIILTIITSVIPFLSNHKLFFNNGYTLYSFIYLYFAGAYLRLYPLKKEKFLKKVSIKKLRFILVSIFLCAAILNYGIFIGVGFISLKTDHFISIYNHINNVKLDYSNMFIVIQSIAYFLLFETFNLKSKIVNYLSKLTFGIYLIHDNYFIRTRLLIYNRLKINVANINSYKFILYVFFITLLIYLVCCFIEFIRQKFVNIINIIRTKIKKT